MKLTNFELRSGVALMGLGHLWDLHNGGEFAALDLLPEYGAIRLRWRRTQFGFGEGNTAATCSIRFDNVSSIWIKRTDGGAVGDARTLDQLSFVVPREVTRQDVIARNLREPANANDGNILFQFMSGFEVEISAEIASLETE